MLSCKVTVYTADDYFCKVVHAHSYPDLYHEIAEVCAEFDAVAGHNIRAITLTEILEKN